MRGTRPRPAAFRRDFVDAAALDFVRRTAAREDEVLASVRAACQSAGLPSITPEAGRTLEVLVRILGAERVLEIGTCLGYSTLWLARGLQRGGKVETIDVDAARHQQAREWARRAGADERIKFLTGAAQDLLPRLPPDAFDLAFIDADKEPMPYYLDEALRLVRSGGVIAADNVFWGGSTFDSRPGETDAKAIRQFVDKATNHPDLASTILPLGDGLLVAWRR